MGIDKSTVGDMTMKIMFEDKVIDRYPIKINGKIKAVLDLYAKLKAEYR